MIDSELKELQGQWIPCEKGTYPEDILPGKYWRNSLSGHKVQSFKVKYRGESQVECWGIRCCDSKGYWDHKKDCYGWWKLREDMFK